MWSRVGVMALAACLERPKGCRRLAINDWQWTIGIENVLMKKKGRISSQTKIYFIPTQSWVCSTGNLHRGRISHEESATYEVICNLVYTCAESNLASTRCREKTREPSPSSRCKFMLMCYLLFYYDIDMQARSQSSWWNGRNWHSFSAIAKDPRGQQPFSFFLSFESQSHRKKSFNFSIP